MNRADILAALDWQQSIGADEALGETPVVWGDFTPPGWWARARRGQALVSDSDAPVTPGATPPLATLLDLPVSPAPLTGPSLLTTPADVTVQATTLAALAAEWQASDHCGLKTTALNFVFGEGDPGRGIMVIGEGPGADEDKAGKPFVGKSGQLLDRMLAAIGLNSRADYYITNVTPWRPPGNRTPTPAEVGVLRPYLVRHIELAQPQVIVTLGALALQALLGRRESITKLRGKWLDFAPGDGTAPIRLLPLFHPAALLRNPSLKRQTWADLLALEAELKVKSLLPAAAAAG